MQTKIASIDKQVKSKVRTVIAMHEKADRQTEIEQMKREEERERYLRRQDQQRIEQSIQESKEDLAAVILK